MLFPCKVAKKWLYILKLENDKYYVGITDDLSRRLNQHFGNRGFNWTKLHKPLSMVHLRSSVPLKMENDVSTEYKTIHGSENVRGGSWCDIHDHHKKAWPHKQRLVRIPITHEFK